MPKKPAGLPQAEWSVMEALWSRQTATATDLQKDLEPRQGWAYSTVKTMLDRLVEKGFVKLRRNGKMHEYSPRVPRESAVNRVVDDVVDRLLEGSLSPFLSRLIASRRLTRAEVVELRAMLDHYPFDLSNEGDT